MVPSSDREQFFVSVVREFVERRLNRDKLRFYYRDNQGTLTDTYATGSYQFRAHGHPRITHYERVTVAAIVLWHQRTFYLDEAAQLHTSYTRVLERLYGEGSMLVQASRKLGLHTTASCPQRHIRFTLPVALTDALNNQDPNELASAVDTFLAPIQSEMRALQRTEDKKSREPIPAYLADEAQRIVGYIGAAHPKVQQEVRRLLAQP
jgi:hypothetical protein